VSQSAAEAATPAAADSTPSPTVTAPAAGPIPAKPGMTALSGSLMISIVVVVLAFGALVPLFVRWRKRKLLEHAGDQNLSFTHEPSSEKSKIEKIEKPDLPKAA
jgi:uncharacterized protein HemX